MSSLVIEAMTERDLEEVLAIDLASFHAGEVARTDDASVARTKQLREELARTWARLRVARASREIQGYALFWHVADEIHLLNVAVAPAARRRGVGRALVRDVLAYARANAAAKILLEMRLSNLAARRLYEAMGFEPFNVRRRYYSDGEDGVEMMLVTSAR